MSDVALYHWSPTARRGQINRRGLVPGSRSVDGAWKPPFVCFADSPSLAWALSGANHGHHGPAIWDLWMTWLSIPSGVEGLPFDHDPSQIKEYRVYERIYKRDLWMVGTRTIERKPR